MTWPRCRGGEAANDEHSGLVARVAAGANEHGEEEDDDRVLL